MTRITADWLQSDGAQSVFQMLDSAGFQAWFVGGCVRNTILDAPVSDLDLATDARPDVVMELAKTAGLNAIPTGIDHGTVTVVADGIAFEITTFRRDVATDGRRAVVTFSDEIADDARRRDFTMNALYAGGDGIVVDPLGQGLTDLVARHVRFIEDADQRIKEDYLRILRFFRFFAWYGDAAAGIDADGLAACAENIDGLAQLSKERIGQELLKLLAAPDPAPAVASLASTGALAQVLPGAELAMLAVLVHLELQAGLSPDPVRRLAAIGGQDPATLLRLSKSDANRLALMNSGRSTGELAYREGADIAIDALAITAASLGAAINPEQVDFARFAAGQKMPVLAADLMPALSGKALGAALKQAEARWIASDFKLTKAQLLG